MTNFTTTAEASRTEHLELELEIGEEAVEEQDLNPLFVRNTTESENKSKLEFTIRESIKDHTII